jgi:calcineurin-like phosphoesterase family protein
MIYLCSDFHLIQSDKETRQTYVNQEALNSIFTWPTLTEDDTVIFLGDLVDDTITPDIKSPEFIMLKNRLAPAWMNTYLLRGNNDTLPKVFYNKLGFRHVKFAHMIKANDKDILLSHTSVDLTRVAADYSTLRYDQAIDYNIHGHIHRKDTDPDTILYYHPCDRNINLCTKDLRQYRLTPITDIDLEKESFRNRNFINASEKPGMSRYIQNEAYNVCDEFAWEKS